MAEASNEPEGFDLMIGQPAAMDRRQAWFGGVYMSALAAHAGYLWTPTPGEGDIHSLDGHITFWAGQSTYVQIKCTRTQFVRSKSYPIAEAWRRQWEDLRQPAYFMVVRVPEDVSTWLDHGFQDWDTLVHAAAFWTRIDPVKGKSSLQVSAADRVTADTLELWHETACRETLAGYGANWEGGR